VRRERGGCRPPTELATVHERLRKAAQLGRFGNCFLERNRAAGIGHPSPAESRGDHGGGYERARTIEARNPNAAGRRSVLVRRGSDSRAEASGRCALVAGSNTEARSAARVDRSVDPARSAAATAGREAVDGDRPACVGEAAQLRARLPPTRSRPAGPGQPAAPSRLHRGAIRRSARSPAPAVGDLPDRGSHRRQSSSLLQGAPLDRRRRRLARPLRGNDRTRAQAEQRQARGGKAYESQCTAIEQAKRTTQRRRHRGRPRGSDALRSVVDSRIPFANRTRAQRRGRRSAGDTTDRRSDGPRLRRHRAPSRLRTAPVAGSTTHQVRPRCFTQRRSADRRRRGDRRLPRPPSQTRRAAPLHGADEPAPGSRTEAYRQPRRGVQRHFAGRRAQHPAEAGPDPRPDIGCQGRPARQHHPVLHGDGVLDAARRVSRASAAGRRTIPPDLHQHPGPVQPTLSRRSESRKYLPFRSADARSPLVLCPAVVRRHPGGRDRCRSRRFACPEQLGDHMRDAVAELSSLTRHARPVPTARRKGPKRKSRSQRGRPNRAAG